jgi:peptide/nickel transport system permease protein
MTTGVPEPVPTAADAAAPDEAARSPLQLFWSRLRGDRFALVSLGFIAAVVLIALLAPVIVDLAGARPPNEPAKRYLDPAFGTPTGPSSENVFGVDPLGRDLFSRVLYGARVSLVVALVATALSVSIGLLVGLLAGYFGGWVDTGLSRLMDGLVEPGLGVVIFVIAFVNWTVIARVVRGQVLSLREREFVEAARSLGSSHARIITREILPNLTAPLIVYTTLLIPQNILFEAALSYLGVGVQPPDASWGKMIADAADVFDSAWWYMLFPGGALLLTVLAFNILGDGLRDALDPRTARG